MGLYLCILDTEEEEIDGVEIGMYEDYGHFLETITRVLENGIKGSRFPLLTLHSDCDGEWTPEECKVLLPQLGEISEAMRREKFISYKADWQKNLASTLGLKALTLYDSFIDVDGEPLLERMEKLTKVAIDHNLPILFQ